MLNSESKSGDAATPQSQPASDEVEDVETQGLVSGSLKYDHGGKKAGLAGTKKVLVLSSVLFVVFCSLVVIMRRFDEGNGSAWDKQEMLAHDANAYGKGHVSQATIFLLSGGEDPAAMEATLKFLKKTEYFGDRVNLHVIIDAPPPEPEVVATSSSSGKRDKKRAPKPTSHSRTVDKVSGLKWPFGDKNLTVLNQTLGIEEAWLEAWDPKADHEKGVFIEEGVLVSSLYYRWLKSAWLHYGKRRDIAGVSLQFLTDAVGKIKNPEFPFGYNQVGRHGFSPGHEIWRAYLDEIKSGNIISNVTKGEPWTQSFDQFCKEQSLFTIYLNPEEGAMANFGKKENPAKFVPLINGKYWQAKWDHPPRSLPIYADFLENAWESTDDTWIDDGTSILAQAEQSVDLTKLVNTAKAIQGNGGKDTMILQLLNRGFVEMTQNWICNVKDMENVLERTLFVCTDHAAYVDLRRFERFTGLKLNIAVQLFDGNAKMKFGRVGYYLFMLFRTTLLKAFLENDISFFLTEADATWFGNTMVELESQIPEGTDVVYMIDNYIREGSTQMNGGFLWFKSSVATKTAIESLHKKQLKKLNAIFDRNKDTMSTNVRNKGNEQKLWDEVFKSMTSDSAPIKLNAIALDSTKYLSGQWYNHFEGPLTNPTVILNNWIVANSVKKKRAQDFGFWFLDDHDTTCVDVVAPSLQAVDLIEARVTNYTWEPVIEAARKVEATAPSKTVFVQIVTKGKLSDLIKLWLLRVVKNKDNLQNMLSRTLFVFQTSDVEPMLLNWFQKQKVNLSLVNSVVMPFQTMHVAHLQPFLAYKMVTSGMNVVFQSAEFGDFFDPMEFIPDESLLIAGKNETGDVLLVTYKIVENSSPIHLLWFRGDNQKKEWDEAMRQFMVFGHKLAYAVKKTVTKEAGLLLLDYAEKLNINVQLLDLHVQTSQKNPKYTRKVKFLFNK